MSDVFALFIGYVVGVGVTLLALWLRNRRYR